MKTRFKSWLHADASLDQDSSILEGSAQEDVHVPSKALEEASGSINGMDYEGTQSSIIKLYLFLLNIFFCQIQHLYRQWLL